MPIRKRGISPGRIAIHVVIASFSLFCVLPMLLLLSLSLSSDSDLYTYGYSLIPRGIDLSAYKIVFSKPRQILNAYGVTMLVTAAGTLGALWMTSTIAYVISRRDYLYAKPTSFYIFFTMLFSGGLVPWYILLVRGLHLKDTIWVLIIPYLLSPWNVLLMKGFLSSTPMSIIESAKIDGGSELKIFIRIILPISRAPLITVGLFYALAYWNDWWLSLLYIDSPKLVSLQFLLYRIMSNIDYLTKNLANPNVSLISQNIPALSARMAMSVLAVGPMLCIFLFFQKYFVKGITVGSIKG